MEVKSLWMESLRSSHPHPQVLHLILIVYGEVSSGEVSTLGHGRGKHLGRGKQHPRNLNLMS